MLRNYTSFSQQLAEIELAAVKSRVWLAEVQKNRPLSDPRDDQKNRS